MADTLYETDILAWSEREADLLERLRLGERLNTEIDWINLIDEVRDLGRSELHACLSLLRQALIHLLKLTLWPESPDVPHWRQETDTFLDDAASHFTPSMRQNIDVPLLYDKALRNLRTAGELRNIELPPTPPTLDDLLRDPPDIDRLLAKMAGDGDAGLDA